MTDTENGPITMTRTIAPAVSKGPSGSRNQSADGQSPAPSPRLLDPDQRQAAEYYRERDQGQDPADQAGDGLPIGVAVWRWGPRRRTGCPR